MKAQVYHYPPDLFKLLVDTIPRLCRSKKDVLLFFMGAGVSQRHMADIGQRLSQDASNINKYEIARTVLIRLNSDGDKSLRERREVVKRVVEFEDFSRCWPDDQMPATGLVTKVRELVNVKDSFTRMKQGYEYQLDKERKDRQEKEKQRLESLRIKTQRRKAIKANLIALYDELDTKMRGKKLEEILKSLFEIENILVRDAFTITGDDNEGVVQQIDGAIEVNSYLYLVEMKWWIKALAPKDIAQHVMRIYQRTDARGIFISAAGYTDAAVGDIKKALNQPIVVLFTIKEIILLLEEERSFESLLKQKVEARVS